jgi:hypothetical protein
MDISQRPQPVKTAKSGRSRLPIRPHTGPLDERPIVGGEEQESYGGERKCQDWAIFGVVQFEKFVDYTRKN